MTHPANTILLGVVTVFATTQPRMTERALADVARVSIPMSIALDWTSATRAERRTIHHERRPGSEDEWSDVKEDHGR